MPEPSSPKSGGQRTVPMEVLGLGFSRTGTESMKLALETLGYVRTNRGFVVLSSPPQMDIWITVIKAKYYSEGTPYGREEWDVLLGDCMAVTDMPHLLFVEELLAAYADAKIVLKHAGPNSWLKSYQSTVASVLQPSLHKRFLAWPDPSGPAKVQYFSRLGFNVFFRTEHVTEELAKKRFREYYDNIRRLVPKERL
ncbi:hypothetical protein B0H14DRAFT_2572966 [Mycena olivaceomarginata]|nr:hypothetical protein B0H14DRAFT_2572966 [Mycena olivaceomarginata]